MTGAVTTRDDGRSAGTNRSGQSGRAGVSRTAKHIQKVTRTGPVRLGFVPLIDAAPLVVAQERGFFADERLNVSLERRIGWANVRDNLAYGHLDASHALLGLPLASVVQAETQGEPLVSVLGLSSGGN